MQKKKRKKNSDSECCEIYFFPQHYSLSPYCLIIQAELRETPHVCLDQTSDRTHDRVFCSQCDRHFFVPLVLSTESAPKQGE